MAPTVSITSPANGSTTSGSAFDVTFNATDDTGVRSVELYLDGNFNNRSTSAPYTIGLLGVAGCVLALGGAVFVLLSRGLHGQPMSGLPGDLLLLVAVVAWAIYTRKT